MFERKIHTPSRADSAPKLIPATVIGMASSMGLEAKRVPSTVLVAQRSRALERIERASSKTLVYQCLPSRMWPGMWCGTPTVGRDRRHF